MLFDVLSFYLQGLVMSAVLVLTALFFWVAYRATRQIDKTVQERRTIIYEGMLIALMSIPILSFACATLLIMFRA